MSVFDIAGRRVGEGEPPFIIAEMSGNHNGSLERALAIVDMAAEAGADAIKLQTYTADTMTIRSDNPDFLISDPQSLWGGRMLYDLYEEAHTPWQWHAPIFDRARKHGLIAFSTPFDFTAVDFLEKLEVPAYKIASFENTDLPLIREVAKTGKPLIISSGTASMPEITAAVEAARGAGCTQLIVLKCTSSYPAPAHEANLLAIPTLRQALGVPIGLSDHTQGIGTSVAAVALGAVVIEKHVTLSRAEGGVDAAFSLEPQELAALVREARQAQASLGSATYAPTASELASHKFRRSLYVVKTIRAGERFTPEHVRAIRPGFGLPTDMRERIVGSARAACDLQPGTALSTQHLRWD
ncbi:MAG: pseudaminic acid synthase [Alphaproteobacteria bacterium]|nr:pseudaminic acid synthase [Alphaproteobacteria bacterium]